VWEKWRKSDIEFIPSTEPPVGLGEPATTAVAPAIGNAIFADHMRACPSSANASGSGTGGAQAWKLTPSERLLGAGVRRDSNSGLLPDRRKQSIWTLVSIS
jgi:hypothetical protein